MAYSKEAVAHARQRLAAAKADRESENRARLAESYAKVPRLKEIDILLRRTMAAAAQAVFTQGGDAQAAMEQVRQENLTLQQERAALLREYFPEGYLDEQPICRLCGGSGYVGSHMCSCLDALCRQEQQKLLGTLGNGSESFQSFRLDYYPAAVDPRYGASPKAIMERNFRLCKEYAMQFTANAGNLLFIGGTGLGKTYLAMCIAKTVAAGGYSVVYESAIDLFNKLERAKFAPSDDTLREVQRIESADLLVVDDLGTEMPGQFVTAALYGLLNGRLLAGKPMVITTNLNVEEAGKRYSAQIASRLYGDFSRLTFVGNDIRVIKNRGL